MRVICEYADVIPPNTYKLLLRRLIRISQHHSRAFERLDSHVGFDQ